MECIKYINDLKIELDMLNDSLQECRDEREYKNITRIVKSKEELMKKYKDNLAKLSDCQIEYRIYLKMLNGLSPTRAVEEVANENYMNDMKPTDITRIWKDYYKKVKEVCNIPVKRQ